MVKTDYLKKLVKTPKFLAEMKDVFFEGMNAGYANSSKKKSVLWLPGSKTIEYIRGPWRVIDTYHVTQLSSRSGGTMIISYEEDPVWMMQYFGEYEEDAIPCLKAALRDAYTKKNFFGGRGPFEFVHGDFVYQNPPEKSRYCEFGELFYGEESVCNKNKGGRLCGWHTYHGGSMI